MLGLPPSTYDYYEASRVPPADVLVRIADVAAVDLRWLLTGETSGHAVPAGHPALQRAAGLISAHPKAAEALAAFLDLLAASLEFPQKAPTRDDRTEPTQPPTPDSAQQRWIPVLGRSAAGVPQFWDHPEDQAGTTSLADLIRKHAEDVASRPTPAVAAGDEVDLQTVELISLTCPDDQDRTEFVDAAMIKQRYPDAFAVRIDGDSMSPEIRHGEIVLLSPSAPAAEGKVAVVQLSGQIGVTCKIYRTEGDQVHLVAINEAVPPVTVPAGNVVWALRVLGRVR